MPNIKYSLRIWRPKSYRGPPSSSAARSPDSFPSPTPLFSLVLHYPSKGINVDGISACTEFRRARTNCRSSSSCARIFDLISENSRLKQDSCPTSGHSDVVPNFARNCNRSIKKRKKREKETKRQRSRATGNIPVYNRSVCSSPPSPSPRPLPLPSSQLRRKVSRSPRGFSDFARNYHYLRRTRR